MPEEVDMVPHYNGDACMRAIETALGYEQTIGFLRGQIFKYNWRLMHKGNTIKDLQKLIWYAKRLDTLLQGKPAE